MTAQEPVHQYRLKGLSRWSDGIPPEGYLLEHVETRILYIAPTQPALSESQITSIAYNCNALPEVITDKTLVDFVRAIEAHCRGGAWK